ncbi:hypothetical protein VC83_04048 [Pseudogymnoascus destructans]|uniref:Uncharacterized protein n=1 Tax=Pseudogymnoascus destructans TaxID=655981 RepID=A0A177ACD9_9PEZI|nr:uncharacterized protein VC83_04048 [Pseudogymnoascus destructans]OAF59758.1 hypothetical protein VC83_04048 [Pseudogymnoascus destructans]
MPDVFLKLESLKLSCSEERIKLLVTSSATLRAQDERFRRVLSGELLNLMESGKVCISRGPGCDLGFGFSFKNLQSNGPAEKALVEELGRFVLGAPWWEQLPVSPSLNSPSSSCPDVGPTFSIKLHDTLPSLHSNGHPNPEESPIADLHVPECVPDMRLVGIKFFFTFEPTRDTPLPILIKQTATEDDMLFEDGCESDPDLFEDIMDLEVFDSSTPRHEALFDTSSVLDGMTWEDHSFVEDQYYADGCDNMLLYRTDHSSVHLPTPEASMTFNSQQDTSMLDSMEPHSLNNLTTKPSLKLTTAKQLTDVALRTLFGGRQTKFTPSIKVRKPRPKRPLSSIMPLLWSPSFKNAMSERSAFLNTISSILSSLPKTSQLPSLQKKLSIIHENPPARSAETRPPRLSETIQAHVFRMMQTTLYEPIASRRLRPSVIEESGEEEARSGLPSRDCENSGSAQVDIGNTSDDVVDVVDADEGFEDLFGEELLSDGEMDMLFDLEILRNRGERGSCSMLFGSGEGDSSMLMVGEEVHEDATREIGEEDSILSTEQDQRNDGGEHILYEREFWDSSIVVEELEEDARMIMDTEPGTVHGYSSMYLDDPYINNEAILI